MKQLTGFLLGVVLLSSGMAHAQSIRWIMKADVPFEFSVGNKHFPAGKYSLVQPLQHFLQLRDAQNRVIAYTFTNAIETSHPSSTPHLSFYVSGDKRILGEVWLAGDTLGDQLYVPEMKELRAARVRPLSSGSAQGGSQ